MKAIYTSLIAIYSLLISIAAWFSPKARLWVQGRKGWKKDIQTFNRKGEKVVWVHCASLGEFEQGRPLIEKIRKEREQWTILLTFFSPSGYEIRKDYGYADKVMYLPADRPSNVSFFLDTVKPDMVLFIKYEFWYNYLGQLRRRGIPTYLVSGIFRPGQYFFRWYGRFARRMFSVFTHIFVQDHSSKMLLEGIGYTRCTVAGDTRFDRVSQIAKDARDLPVIDMFRGSERLFVAGSSWEPDEDIIIRYINANPGTIRWLIAPHEIDEAHLQRIEKKLEIPSVRYSKYDSSSTDSRVMLIDNIGMLSSVYRYAAIAAVGGGFGKGIHNILEPACWGIPVLFGPNHKMFREAIELISLGGASSFNSFEEFSMLLGRFLSDESSLMKAGSACGHYISENKGATDMVFSEIIV